MLGIEIDSKCPPTATEAELAKRRGPRRPKLVIATGQVEGEVRHLVGERFDGAGMRWRQEKAETRLHLRCIELNHDWQDFVTWFQGRTRRRLKKSKRYKILTNQPLTLTEAA